MTQSNIAIIPARGGSKRIPRKNIRLFSGQPIIAYTIKAALSCGLFNRVIVSTDDAEVADVCRQFGAEVPFIRPAELANDHAVIAEVMKHACDWLVGEHDPFTSLCCLYATAPMLQIKKLFEAAALIEADQADYVLSITSFTYPIQRALQLDENGCVKMIKPEYGTTRSQDLEECYHDAAQFFWGSRAAIMGEVDKARTRGIVVPHYSVQDIDTDEDWHYAEIKFKAAQQMGLIAS